MTERAGWHRHAYGDKRGRDVAFFVEELERTYLEVLSNHQKKGVNISEKLTRLTILQKYYDECYRQFGNYRDIIKEWYKKN